MTAYREPLTQDDFSEDDWDALCEARLRRDARAWYGLLRTRCDYRAGGHRVKKHMEKLCDAWLQAHPTWVAARGRE